MPADGSHTRQKILDAAQSLVMQHGFAATSVDEIQEAAGVSRGTIFYHFDSKDDIARELLERYARMDAEVTREFMNRAESLARDPLQQLLIFIRLHEEFFEEMDGELPGCLFASYSYEAGLFDQAAHDLIRNSVDSFRDLVAERLRAAFDRHSPVMEADADELADLAYGIMQGAFILSRVRGQPAIMAAHLRHYRNYLELVCGVAGPVGAD